MNSQIIFNFTKVINRNLNHILKTFIVIIIIYFIYFKHKSGARIFQLGLGATLEIRGDLFLRCERGSEWYLE